MTNIIKMEILEDKKKIKKIKKKVKKMTNIIKMEILKDKKNVIESLLKDKFENEPEKQKSIIQSLEILINFIAELKGNK